MPLVPRSRTSWPVQRRQAARRPAGRLPRGPARLRRGHAPEPPLPRPARRQDDAGRPGRGPRRARGGPGGERVPVLRMLSRRTAEIEARARELARRWPPIRLRLRGLGGARRVRGRRRGRADVGPSHRARRLVHARRCLPTRSRPRLRTGTPPCSRGSPRTVCSSTCGRWSRRTTTGSGKRSSARRVRLVTRRPDGIMSGSMRVSFVPRAVVAAPRASPRPAQDVVKRVGNVTFTADPSQAFPGGLVVVRLSSTRALGAAYAILDGRRAPFYLGRRARAPSFPSRSTAVGGPTTLGVEILGRRGRQRIPLSVTIEPRLTRRATVAIPESTPRAPQAGRRSCATAATSSPSCAPRTRKRPGRCGRPSRRPRRGLREPPDLASAAPRWSRMLDSLYGEGHRGRDFEVPTGTVGHGARRGNVLFAASLTLAGNTRGDRPRPGRRERALPPPADRRPGGRPRARRATAVGLSGDTGIAPSPQVHWRTYLHGVGVDPECWRWSWADRRRSSPVGRFVSHGQDDPKHQVDEYPREHREEGAQHEEHPDHERAHGQPLRDAAADARDDPVSA